MHPDDPQDSPLFARGPSSTARLVLLALASVLLMTADHRGHYLDQLRAGFGILARPLQAVAAFPSDAARWITKEISDRQALIDENRRLERAILKARGELQTLGALRAENARLRALLDAAERQPHPTMVAEIEQVDLDPYDHRVLLSKGTRDGVYRNQPLVDEYGVMGQVVEAGPLSSYVMLISDPNHALPVEINRTGLRSIALGTGDTGRLTLTDLPLNANVRQGDLLVTSGLGGRFPPGVPAGRITRVNRDPGEAFAEVDAAPVAALDRSRLVLLIWPEQTGAEARP
jgi:rod shape-determining protein MreC